jgi:hypothetical protein
MFITSYILVFNKHRSVTFCSSSSPDIELHAPNILTQTLKLMGEVGNSIILQHSPSNAGSLRPHRLKLEWAAIILFKLMGEVGNSLILQHVILQYKYP